MMIEKDFVNKRGFPVVLARPKRLFGTVYAEVPQNIEKVFNKKYSKYIHLLKSLSQKILQPLLIDLEERPQLPLLDPQTQFILLNLIKCGKR